MALRTTKFLGIAQGSSTSVTAIQAGIERSIGPLAWRVSGGGGGEEPPLPTNASFSIIVEPAAVPVAPHAQWFRVTDIEGFAPAAPVSGGEVYDPQAHDITWIWSFGDAGATPNAAVNLPDAWRDTNTAYGKRVAHVFASPGTFTVTCWAFDSSGNVGMATAELTVADPEVFFAGNRTICLNPPGDGAFTGAPAGAQQVTSWSGVVSAVQGLGQPCRILLKRGATYDGVQNWNWANNTRNVYLADYGSGELPRLRPPEAAADGFMLGVRREAGCDSNKFINLDLHGWWDPESETGSYGGPIYAFENQNNLLTHGCRIRNWSSFVIGGYETFKMDVVISNTWIQNWRGFGIFAQGGERADTRCAVVGCAIHQSPNAMQGHEMGILGHGLGNTNGPWRNGHITQAFFSCTSMFANTGGSGANNYERDPAVFPKIAVNPAFRAQSDQAGLYSASIPILWNVERCTFEGGFNVFVISETNRGRPGNYIIDKAIVIANAQTFGLNMELPEGGTTARNVFCYIPNSPATHDVPDRFITAAANHLDGNASRPVRIHGSTFYSPRTSANAQYNNASNANVGAINGLGGWTAFTDIVIENNIIHCPAQNTPVVTSAPLELVEIPGLMTQYRGPRWNFDPISVTLGSAVANGGTVTFSYPNDTGQHPAGQATNQAYFLTPPGENRHVLAGHGIPDVGALRSWLGQFSVSFGASNITVTNTSGQTWASGRTVYLLLDRRNSVPANAAIHASPPTVLVPRPITGSAALGAATLGLVPLDDIFGRIRLTPRSRGALEINV
jgi:hypothetical protein